MLTNEQAIVDYDAGRAVPDRLVRSRHGHYVAYAERMLAIYRDGAGCQRRRLHQRVEAIFVEEPDCPIRRIRAFCKLLDDRSVYQEDTRGEAAVLRLKLFTAAAQYHPLVTRPDRLFEHSEAEVKARLAAELGTTWQEIDSRLYTDVLACQRLERFDGYDGPEALLSRYNVAQLQACLYRAEGMTIEAGEDFKTILRYAKLARLMHEVTPLGPSRYRIVLSGPATVLGATRRYGVGFARFLPALLACRSWRMSAVVPTPWKGRATLRLSDRDGFRSHLPPPEEFDSAVEEAFARKFGPHRDGWTLIREGKVLQDRQTAFIPDFLFRHDSGVEVLLEIVGFWTPQYLARKREVLRRFGRQPILLAVPRRLAREGACEDDRVILYKTALKIEPVLERLRKLLPAAPVGRRCRSGCPDGPNRSELSNPSDRFGKG